jgi:hypothetical protein
MKISTWLKLQSKRGCSQKKSLMKTDSAYTFWCEPWRRSISHQLTVQHLQDSNWLPALPDPLTIHRLTDPTTQQFNDTHFLSCISTLIQFQRNSSLLIHRICTSSKAQAFLAIRSSHQKEESPKVASTYCFSFSSIPFIQLSNKSSITPQTQRKNLKHS